MNSVKKFATFDEMKACEDKTTKHESRLKKHNDFKKLIMDIRESKTSKINRGDKR